MTRSEEESTLLPGELADLQQVMKGFDAGNFGYYGDMYDPGLIGRLEGVRFVWDKLRQIRSRATAETVRTINLQMSIVQIGQLRAIAKSKIENRKFEIETISREHFDLDRWRQFILEQAFWKDLFKACNAASKAATEKHLEEIRAANAALGLDPREIETVEETEEETDEETDDGPGEPA